MGTHSAEKPDTRRKTLSVMFMSLVFCFSLPLPTRAQEISGSPARTPSLTSHSLTNGLSLILLELPENQSLSMGISFRGGADAQTTRTAGMFHLLEQVLFRGPASIPGEPEPAGAIEAFDAEAFDGGAREFRFGFSFSLPYHLLRQGLDTIAYLFSSLRLESAFADSNALETAKSASLLRINQVFSDPDSIYGAALDKKLFGDAPWRLDVPGPGYNIEAATQPALENFAATWLVPNNAAVVIAGDFITAELLPQVESAFSAWKRGPDPLQNPPKPFPKPGISRPAFMVYPDPSIAQGEAHIELRYRGPDAGTPRSAAAEIWAEMASLPDSRLVQAVSKSMPKWAAPRDLTTHYAISRNASWLSVGTTISIDPKASLADAILGFKETVRGTEMYAMKTNPNYFSQKQYQTAREAVAARREWQLSNPSEAVAILSDEWIFGGVAWSNARTQNLLKVEGRDMAAFADEFFMRNLEVTAVRLSTEDYAARRKSFDNYGFELITPQKAFWWR
jgi:zinc protease